MHQPIASFPTKFSPTNTPVSIGMDAPNNSTKASKTTTGVTANTVRHKSAGLTAKHGTQKRRKKRMRKCKCGCGVQFTPKPKAMHQKFFSDACRKRYYRRQSAIARRLLPKQPPVLELFTCEHCGFSFFGSAGKRAKYCNNSHKQAAYEKRYEATIDALSIDLNMTRDQAADLIESISLRRVKSHLTLLGWRYDYAARSYLKSPNVITHRTE